MAETCTFNIQPFYGTQSETNKDHISANIGALPIMCKIDTTRENLIAHIQYFVKSLDPIIDVHTDYKMDEMSYYNHLLGYAQLLEVNLEQTSPQIIFNEIWETSLQHNQIYIKYGLNYEPRDVKQKFKIIQRCLKKSKSEITNLQLKQVYTAFCDYMLTYNSPFLVTKLLPLVELLMFCKEYGTILPVDIKAGENALYKNIVEDACLNYDFKDMYINVALTHFKRFLLADSHSYLRYLTATLLPESVHNAIVDKRDEQIDWDTQIKVLLEFFIKKHPPLKKIAVNLLYSGNTSESNLESLVHKLHTCQDLRSTPTVTLNESIMTIVDEYNPIFSSKWKFHQFPSILLLAKARVRSILVVYVYVFNTVINELIKSKQNKDLFQNEKNLKNRAGNTLKNLVKAILDKEIIHSNYWGMVNDKDVEILFKILTAMMREPSIRSFTGGNIEKTIKQFF